MDKKMKWLLTATILIAILAASGYFYRMLSSEYQEEINPPTNGAPVAKIAPDFTVYDGAGKTVKLSDFKGKPVVLNFWASWCPPCRQEMPEFERVSRELNGKVVFLMVNMTDGSRETEEKAKALIQKEGYTFPVYFDTKESAAYAYGITALPTTCFIDAEGRLIRAVRGAIDSDSLRASIALIQSGK